MKPRPKFANDVLAWSGMRDRHGFGELSVDILESARAEDPRSCILSQIDLLLRQKTRELARLFES